MQIMNLENLLKNLWWSVSAFKTLNDLPDSFIFVNKDGIVEYINDKASQCFGIELDELNPTKLNDIIKDGMDLAEEAITTQKPVPAIAKIPGREFHIELNASKRRNGYCLLIRDVTKLTDEIVTEEKIARFNGEKNAMLFKLENDIKSPITSISGFSQGLLDGLGGQLSEKQAKYIKIINSNSAELYHFMDKLIEFSTAESSLYEEKYQNFDVVEVCKAVSADFEAVMSAKKIAFDIDYDNIEKRTIYSDYNAVRKICRNLLENSVTMTDGGYILIKLSRPEEETASIFGLNAEEIAKTHLQISFIDTGASITDEEKKFLCDPYAQLEKGKKNFVRALQLGTASILTKRANGFINIKPQVTKGTRYDIVIPIEKD